MLPITKQSSSQSVRPWAEEGMLFSARSTPLAKPAKNGQLNQ